MDNDNFLDDIKDLPEWVELYRLNHWSPSQVTKMNCMWGYEYLYLTQEQRRALPANSKMFSGNMVGDMLQLTYGNFLWKHQIGKGLIKSEILPQRKIFDKVLDKFNLYEPVDDLDAAQHDVNRLGLAKAYQTLKTAYKEIGLTSPTECERSVSMYLDGCILPIIGRIDMENENSFIELKTKWRKRNKMKKDMTYSYSLPSIKENYMGWHDHILQVAFYYFACEEKKKPHLLVMNEENYNIFTEDNCEDLRPENLKLHLVKMKKVIQEREAILEKHAGKNTWHQDIVPDFTHYFWKTKGEHLDIAKKLWGLA
mgnify:FL=1|tara:strand:+ start:1082 stop:2014 length:933 start_codon:yes stop_codon:yes gene_type:complete